MGNWKATARVCTACGQPEAFPTNTRFGVRHDCRECGCYAWGDGEFRTKAQHAAAARTARGRADLDARRAEARQAISRQPAWLRQQLSAHFKNHD